MCRLEDFVEEDWGICVLETAGVFGGQLHPLRGNLRIEVGDVKLVT